MYLDIVKHTLAGMDKFNQNTIHFRRNFPLYISLQSLGQQSTIIADTEVLYKIIHSTEPTF